MTSKYAVVLAVATFLLGTFAGFWSARFIEIDKCIDSGGLWNSATVRCEVGMRRPVSMKACLQRGGHWDYAQDACDLE